MKKIVNGILVGVIVVLAMIGTLNVYSTLSNAREKYEEAYTESYAKAFAASYDKAYREAVSKKSEPVMKTETFYEYRDGVKWTVNRIYFEEN